MCEFRIGQKVVCVDAESINEADGFVNVDRHWEPGAQIVNGDIYTISDISIDIDGAVLLSLKEVRRSPGTIAFWALRGRMVGYGAFRFRPLVTDDSRYDISVFQRMCVDATTRVSAE